MFANKLKNEKLRLRAPLRRQVDYSLFDQLDGSHPWMQAVPGAYVSYRVRELNRGKVIYFNYALAKEMGLIPIEHSEKMNEELEKKLLEAFSIQILNEYDEKHLEYFKNAKIKANKYMATRYLQLQHSSRSGKTSGDGRSIWNGVVNFKGKMWDVSSRGTGVTCLSPGAVLSEKPLKTGNSDFGYGCGRAEIDELVSAALSAEIFHLQGINTERVLCVIDLGQGYGIGVRAGLNLLRPAHHFLYLKQNRWKELKQSLDYFIDRQIKNSEWTFKTQGAMRYRELAEKIGDSFAKFAATLEVDYIFAWIDWDGDNLLADAGIIDYGSVRQFGLRHDHYRYDDIERYSTTLDEQKVKARAVVQTYVQIADFMITKKRKPLASFSKDLIVKQFKEKFIYYKKERLLYRWGFDKDQRSVLLKESKTLDHFYKLFSALEKEKIQGKIKKVADGINLAPLFNLRKTMYLLPQFFLENGLQKTIKTEDLTNSMISSLAKKKDKEALFLHHKNIFQFQDLYKKLILLTKKNKEELEAAHLKEIFLRARKLNGEERITGNATINIVALMLDYFKKGLPVEDFQFFIDHLIQKFVNYPEVYKTNFQQRKIRLIKQPQILDRLLKIIQNSAEDI